MGESVLKNPCKWGGGVCTIGLYRAKSYRAILYIFLFFFNPSSRKVKFILSGSSIPIPFPISFLISIPFPILLPLPFPISLLFSKNLSKALFFRSLFLYLPSPSLCKIL